MRYSHVLGWGRCWYLPMDQGMGRDSSNVCTAPSYGWSRDPGNGHRKEHGARDSVELQVIKCLCSALP